MCVRRNPISCSVCLAVSSYFLSLPISLSLFLWLSLSIALTFPFLSYSHWSHFPFNVIFGWFSHFYHFPISVVFPFLSVSHFCHISISIILPFLSYFNFSRFSINPFSNFSRFPIFSRFPFLDQFPYLCNFHFCFHFSCFATFSLAVTFSSTACIRVCPSLAIWLSGSSLKLIDSVTRINRRCIIVLYSAIKRLQVAQRPREYGSIKFHVCASVSIPLIVCVPICVFVFFPCCVRAA